MASQRTLVTYLVAYLVAFGTAIRYLTDYLGHPFQWIVYGLLTAYFLLMLIEPWLTKRTIRLTHLYLFIQAGIIIVLSLIPPNKDYFSILFIPLILQAVTAFPPRKAFLWIGIFTTIMAILFFYELGWEVSFPFVVIFTTLYLFFGSYAAIVHQADTARKKNQSLINELQEAHYQLQTFTAQSEELAVIQERNRLARDLHDSVTQTIFSMSLTTEAARILYHRDPPLAAPQLANIQTLAKSALKGMRSIILELRPTAIVEQGLVPALRHYVMLLDRQNGLSVALNITGDSLLNDLEAQCLFRVIQEALNNIVKHAQTDKATVDIIFNDDRLFVQIDDFGQGFELDKIELEKDWIGISTMRERVEMLGGTLKIESRLGEGTRVIIEIVTIDENEKNG